MQRSKRQRKRQKDSKIEKYGERENEKDEDMEEKRKKKFKRLHTYRKLKIHLAVIRFRVDSPYMLKYVTL